MPDYVSLCGANSNAAADFGDYGAYADEMAAGRPINPADLMGKDINRFRNLAKAGRVVSPRLFLGEEGYGSEKSYAEGWADNGHGWVKEKQQYLRVTAPDDATAAAEMSDEGSSGFLEGATDIGAGIFGFSRNIDPETGAQRGWNFSSKQLAINAGCMVGLGLACAFIPGGQLITLGLAAYALFKGVGSAIENWEASKDTTKSWAQRLEARRNAGRSLAYGIIGGAPIIGRGVRGTTTALQMRGARWPFRAIPGFSKSRTNDVRIRAFKYTEARKPKDFKAIGYEGLSLGQKARYAYSTGGIQRGYEVLHTSAMGVFTSPTSGVVQYFTHEKYGAYEHHYFMTDTPDGEQRAKQAEVNGILGAPDAAKQIPMMTPFNAGTSANPRWMINTPNGVMSFEEFKRITSSNRGRQARGPRPGGPGFGPGPGGMGGFASRPNSGSEAWTGGGYTQPGRI